MTSTATPTIAVIALGGTIAMTRTSTTPGVAPSLTADDLLAAVPGLDSADVMVQATTFRTVPGASLTLQDLAELARHINQLDGRVDGVVITQGTDTLEETAFFLDATVAASVTTVVTGAMRNPTLAGADGPANLLTAIQVAAHPSARELGCVVVMADEIHAARHVRKTDSTSTSAFTSPNTGPIGRVTEGRPRILATPAPPLRISLPPTRTAWPAVPVVPAVLGDNFAVLQPRRDDLDGLVIAAFGVGHVPADAVDLLGDYAARIPVVLASRTGAGPVHRASYAFAGSEQDLQNRGLVNAGYLDSFKARILLSLLLATDATRADITAAFGNAADPARGIR